MPDNVKMMPVARLVMLVKDDTPVGMEVLWENVLSKEDDCCTVLNLARMAMNDAGWIVRQVKRMSTDNKYDDLTKESGLQ